MRFTFVKTHLLGGGGNLQGVVDVVVVVVVTFRPNWAQKIKISLKAIYQVCGHQKKGIFLEIGKSPNFEHFTAPEQI